MPCLLYTSKHGCRIAGQKAFPFRLSQPLFQPVGASSDPGPPLLFVVGVRRDEIHQTVLQKLPAPAFPGKTGFSGKGSRIHLVQASGLALQLRRMVLFIDPFIALRMGQNGPEAEGGKAVQAVPDVRCV